ncbi:SRPBCC family protein [Halovivax cerinus]|uniref:SRPBCC family protein n=1 Tax=Halovivax cerinus TaxID=1487865 RepID=A0ABD5NJ75_9EURY|nr:SRPBCC family protein [Halovivax cerinus]
MTVRVTRTDAFDVSPSELWAFIGDPANRARAISVVRSFSVDPSDPRRCTWEVELPIPFVDRTATVETHDRVREPPSLVEFVGRSAAMDVTGRHEIDATDAGSRLESEFVVDGSLPGVERYFTRKLDDELENLRRAAERSFAGPDAEGST